MATSTPICRYWCWDRASPHGAMLDRDRAILEDVWSSEGDLVGNFLYLLIERGGEVGLDLLAPPIFAATHVKRAFRLADFHPHRAFERGIGDPGRNQANRSNRVVVSGNEEIGVVRIAVSSGH